MRNRILIKIACRKELILLCLFLMVFSLIGHKNGMVTNKYFSENNIEKLFKNYRLFSADFSGFTKATISLREEADTDHGWETFYYLLPLFIFLKMLGGLNLQNLYFFNLAIGIINLILFYRICEKYFNKQAAIIGGLFLTFSSWFFEFTMSISYHFASITVALILIYLMFECATNQKMVNFFFLGAATALSLYYYGPIRFIFPAVAIVLFNVENYSSKRLVYFLSGLMPILILYFILSRSFIIELFDAENIFKTYPGEYNLPWFLRLRDNLNAFLSALSGGHIIKEHACLMHKLLSLPLATGIIYALKKSRDRRYRLLLFTSAAILILPVLTTMVHTTPRRFVFYIIPVYMLIGIGGSWIVKAVSSVKRKNLRFALWLLIASLSICIIGDEFGYTTQRLWFKKQSPDFVYLAMIISELPAEQPLYYLRETPHELFEDDSESWLLMLAIRNKKGDTEVKQIVNLDSLDFADGAYIIKSPLISRNTFEDLTKKRGLYYKELLSVPVGENYCSEEGCLQYKDHALRVYIIKNGGMAAG